MRALLYTPRYSPEPMSGLSLTVFWLSAVLFPMSHCGYLNGFPWPLFPEEQVFIDEKKDNMGNKASTPKTTYGHKSIK